MTVLGWYQAVLWKSEEGGEGSEMFVAGAVVASIDTPADAAVPVYSRS